MPPSAWRNPQSDSAVFRVELGLPELAKYAPKETGLFLLWRDLGGRSLLSDMDWFLDGHRLRTECLDGQDRLGCREMNFGLRFGR